METEVFEKITIWEKNPDWHGIGCGIILFLVDAVLLIFLFTNSFIWGALTFFILWGGSLVFLIH